MIDLDHHARLVCQVHLGAARAVRARNISTTTIAAIPQAVDAGLQWGWRTRFDHLGAIARPRCADRADRAGDRRHHDHGLPRRGQYPLGRHALSLRLPARDAAAVAQRARFPGGSRRSARATMAARSWRTTMKPAGPPPRQRAGRCCAMSPCWPKRSTSTAAATRGCAKAMAPRQHQNILRLTLRFRGRQPVEFCKTAADG